MAASAAVFVAAIIYFVAQHQIDDMKHEMLWSNEVLEEAIYSGIKYPMTIGDKEGVEQELANIKISKKRLEVYICDSEQAVIYTTQPGAAKSKLSAHISNRAFLHTLDSLLNTGHDPERVYEEESGGRRYVLTSYPLLNRRECNHCHGASKKVLGSLVVKMDAEENYAAIAHLRNFNIVISIVGIIALSILMHIILSALVKRPLGNFTARIEEFRTKIPEGDYSTRISLERPDEIGDLIDSFNHLAETLEQKHLDLTALHSDLAAANNELKLSKKELEHLNETLECKVEERTVELRESEERLREFTVRLAEAEERAQTVVSAAA